MSDPLDVKEVPLENMPECQLCNKTHEEIYDTPISASGGRWAYACRPCLDEAGDAQIQATTALGSRTVTTKPKETPPPEQRAKEELEYVQTFSDEQFSNMLLGFEDCYAADGCRVDPDGECQHGYKSPLLLKELI